MKRRWIMRQEVNPVENAVVHTFTDYWDQPRESVPDFNGKRDVKYANYSPPVGNW